ncbi:hypothetical protein RvY_17974 [Ramazzottius varieornatus]|uniref:Uncharacterized protein n=1 Tax=Ramazzottius varieornatus TaxID=947166 RepID=A0A1D1W485_RAMVA|nr:hypothetical protein RvY_17974 [Ramazzottius varieornatus]
MSWTAICLLLLSISVISGEIQDVASNTTMHPGEMPITIAPLEEHKITHLLSFTTLLRPKATTAEPEPLPSPKPLVNAVNSTVTSAGVPLEQGHATRQAKEASHKRDSRQLGYPNMGALNAGFAGPGSAVNNLRIPNPISLGNQQLPFDYYG